MDADHAIGQSKQDQRIRWPAICLLALVARHAYDPHLLYRSVCFTCEVEIDVRDALLDGHITLHVQAHQSTIAESKYQVVSEGTGC